MPEMKTLQGYEIVDAKAREDIEGLRNEGHALKSELPTKVSQLENDSKFITREEVPETDLSEYAKKSELPTVPKKVSELTNDTGYITLAEVPKTDLSEYAKKSEIPDVSDFITSIPSEYITESELNAKGYLTQHQSLEGLATEQYVDDAIADIDFPETDLSGYYTKKQVDNKFDKVSDSYYLDFSAAMLNSPQDATEEMIEFAEHLQAGDKTKDTDACAYIKDTHDNIYYPAVVSYGWTDGKFRIVLTKTGVNLNTIAAQGETYWDTCEIITGSDGKWKSNILGIGCFTFVSKQYVDETIAALEARVAALEGTN